MTEPTRGVVTHWLHPKMEKAGMIRRWLHSQVELEYLCGTLPRGEGWHYLSGDRDFPAAEREAMVNCPRCISLRGTMRLDVVEVSR